MKALDDGGRMVAYLPSHPSGFACIAADPPWYFKNRTEAVSDRDPRRHYSCLSMDDLCAMPVAAVAAKDAHLFMWTTGPFLEKTFDVMRAWGFGYSGIAFTWVKMRRNHNADQLRCIAVNDHDLHVGLGYTTRKNAEFCLLGRRGKPVRLSASVREIILSPVREHSRKPDEFFERVAAYCDGPRLELFARQTRPGWSAWGNETDRFSAAEQAGVR